MCNIDRDSLLFELQTFFKIEPLHKEAALKFVDLALSCCHEKRRGRPKMADTLAELNEIERMVAVAHGREPEEAVPSTGWLNVHYQAFICHCF